MILDQGFQSFDQLEGTGGIVAGGIVHFFFMVGHKSSITQQLAGCVGTF